ncbi:MAG TPA: class I SAM-dependent methyltransferase [Planctomycetaceae bacterium]|nr:class I SAM-dependent methyltransferase [Planctomycetaceae bacterium]
MDAVIYSKYLEGERGPVLDLPCGTGRFLRMLEAERERFLPVGADYSPSMMAVAQYTTRSPLVRCDGFRLPFQSHSFNIVLCSRLILHYHAPKSLLLEFHRVLNKGGVLVFDTLNHLSLRHILAPFFNVVRSVEGKQLWFASLDEVEALLEACGFQIRQRTSRYILPTRAYRFLPGLLIWLLAAVEPAWPENRRVLTYWKAQKV